MVNSTYIYGYRMNVKLFVILVCILMQSCFVSPDSSFVNIVGRDLENFYDYTQNQVDVISLPKNNNYFLIYIKKNYAEYKHAGDSGDKSFLILKNMNTGLEKTLMYGTLGYEYQYAMLSLVKDKIFYTVSDIRARPDNTYLYQQNVKTNEIKKWQILNENEYKKRRDANLFIGGAYITKLSINEKRNMVFYHVKYVISNLYYDGNDYLSLDLLSGKIKEISKEEYDININSLNNYSVGYKFKNKNGIKKFFYIFPYSDNLRENYKKKYNGIYMSDGSKNIRISKLEVSNLFDAQPFWIENGSMIVCGGYLFDTTGEKKELKLVDGRIIFITK